MNHIIKNKDVLHFYWMKPYKKKNQYVLHFYWMKPYKKKNHLLNVLHFFWMKPYKKKNHLLVFLLLNKNKKYLKIHFKTNNIQPKLATKKKIMKL